MKKISIAFLSLSASLLMYSCGGNDSKTDASDTNTDTSTTSGNMGSATGGTASTDTATGTMGSRMADTAAGMTTGVNGTATGQKPDKQATDFVMKAASGGMMEVMAGQLAQEKAKSDRVKQFGGMMVTDHTAANNELKSLATSKGLTVPAELMPTEQKHVDMLKGKSGADFDKAYTSMMVEDHKKDVADFKKAASGSTDPDIKSFASKTLPVLQKHLDSIQAIHGSKM